MLGLNSFSTMGTYLDAGPKERMILRFDDVARLVFVRIW